MVNVMKYWWTRELSYKNLWDQWKYQTHFFKHCQHFTTLRLQLYKVASHTSNFNFYPTFLSTRAEKNWFLHDIFVLCKAFVDAHLWNSTYWLTFMYLVNGPVLSVSHLSFLFLPQATSFVSRIHIYRLPILGAPTLSTCSPIIRDRHICIM